MARQQLVDAFGDGHRAGQVAEDEEGVDGSRGWLEATERSFDRRQLRPEDQLSVSMGIEERLLAEAVTREQEPAAAAVPDREREHAFQGVDQVWTEVLVEVNERFRVAARAQP